MIVYLVIFSARYLSHQAGGLAVQRMLSSRRLVFVFALLSRLRDLPSVEAKIAIAQ